MKTILENGMRIKMPDDEYYILAYEPCPSVDLQVEDNSQISDLYYWAMFWMKEISMQNRVLTVRKKPVEVQAVLFDGSKESLDIINSDKFGGQSTRKTELRDDGTLDIHTLEGVMRASVGDYIIKGVNGEFYPCKPDIFKKTYDVV